MSYELKGLVGVLPGMMSWPLTPPYRLVCLGHGMAMIPLVNAIDDAIETAGSIDDLLTRLSEVGPVADIHAAAYGSTRAQIVEVWHHRRSILKLDEPEAVNKALRRSA